MLRKPKCGYSRTKISRPRCGLLLLGTLSPARLPLDTFPWNMILGIFTKICWENPNLVTVGQKHRDPVAVYCCWRHCHLKRAVCECNVISLLGLARRLKDYANATRCCFRGTLPACIALCVKMYVLTKIKVASTSTWTPNVWTKNGKRRQREDYIVNRLG